MNCADHTVRCALGGSSARLLCRCVLVGDPQQLPATVLSKRSKALAFERSLFERLQLAGWPVHLLRVQYRMHPHIRAFPSAHFYNNELEVRCLPEQHSESQNNRGS